MSDQQFDHCKHPGGSHLRRWKQVNGVVRVARFCLSCGAKVRHESVHDHDLSALPWMDESIALAYRQRMNEFYEAKRRDFLRQQEEQEQAFDKLHHSHVTLMSDKWRAIRRKVLARCKSVCEGCGDRPAVHVHHLTYERLGDEMLFDLAAVCLPCHEKIHGKEIRG